MFFAARGPMRLVELVDSSMESLPPGAVLRIVHQHQAEAMFAFVDEALTLSLLAAWPIVLALITAEVAVMLATRTQSVALSWSLLAPTRLAIGMFILAAGFMGISVGVSGTLDSWLEMSGQRFSQMVRRESAEGTDQKIRPIDGESAR